MRTRRSRSLLGAATVLAALLAVLLTLREQAHWRSEHYCIEREGRLWGGEAGQVPTGFTAECPASSSARADVRGGGTRIEQYTAPGWRPHALERPLVAARYRPIKAEFINPGLYEAFFEKDGLQLYYLASRQEATTSFTLNGPKRRHDLHERPQEKH